MDARCLLERARAVGLRVELVGREIRVSGPASQEPLVRQIFRHDKEVAAVLRGQPPAAPEAVVEEIGVPTPERPTWEGEAESLVRWFCALGPGELPDRPFRLNDWLYVDKPLLFLAALRFHVSLGPDWPRGRMGALVEDLRALRRYIEAPR